jgi:DNA-binding HxlR family transcriptional regulator
VKQRSSLNQSGLESRLYFLSRKHSIAFLEALKFEPKRFIDFEFVSNKRIRSERIRLLRKAGLVKKTIVEGKRGGLC